ncbi:MAG: hypothetical protein WDW21_03845 [Neisseriaceae bacterium]
MPGKLLIIEGSALGIELKLRLEEMASVVEERLVKLELELVLRLLEREGTSRLEPEEKSEIASGKLSAPERLI